MDRAAVLNKLVSWGLGDWIALWMIVEEVECELDPADDEEKLELTLALVEGLLKRGFLAGDSPAASFVRFHAWPDQNFAAVTHYIRREWAQRGGPPGWGDAPWFAVRLCEPGHA